MSYGKKDEDADQAIVKVDRTSVFQEGKIRTVQAMVASTDCSVFSTTFQFFAYISTKMSNTPYKDCSSPFHRGGFPNERSNVSFLWYLEAVPEQGSLPTADGVLDNKRTGQYRGRCHHGHQQHNEGHISGKRRSLQGKRHTGIM